MVDVVNMDTTVHLNPVDTAGPVKKAMTGRFVNAEDILESSVPWISTNARRLRVSTVLHVKMNPDLIVVCAHRMLLDPSAPLQYIPLQSLHLFTTSL